MLATTATEMLPPYLTIPLTNNVLIPHQTGAPANWGLVTLYLAGFAGAALLLSVLVYAFILRRLVVLGDDVFEHRTTGPFDNA